MTSLTLTFLGGAGTVTGAGGLIDCPPSCVVTGYYGDGVRLTATAASGSTFQGWTGPCAGQDATCDLTITETSDNAAIFVKAGTTAPPTATAKGKMK